MPDTDPTNPPAAAAGPSGPPPRAQRPSVARLPTWVNVVLVLTLLASCSAANTAGDAVNRLVGGSSSAESLSPDEVRDLCRLLGAVAAKEGIDLDEALSGDATSSCATVAREAASP